MEAQMRKFILGLAFGMLLGGPALAGMVEKRVSYNLGGTDFQGVLIYDDSVKTQRPAVLMAPNWMGVTEGAVAKAKLLAGSKYVLFIADMYGVKNQPKGFQDARKNAGVLRKNIPLQRDRINKALDVLLDAGARQGLIDKSKVAAIGFCFGGGNVLEMARSGRHLKGVVTFHGSLTTPNPKDGNIKTKVLVLHGADDPAVPKAHRDALETELTAAGVDWQMVAFSGAVHSFTDPGAKRPGRAMYNAKVTKRAYGMMNDFFAEIF